MRARQRSQSEGIGEFLHRRRVRVKRLDAQVVNPPTRAAPEPREYIPPCRDRPAARLADDSVGRRRHRVASRGMDGASPRDFLFPWPRWSHGCMRPR